MTQEGHAQIQKERGLLLSRKKKRVQIYHDSTVSFPRG